MCSFLFIAVMALPPQPLPPFSQLSDCRLLPLGIPQGSETIE